MTGKRTKKSKAASVRKTEEQRAALAVLETVLCDVTARGLGMLTGEATQRLAAHARAMMDAYLPGAAHALRRLAGVAALETLPESDRHRHVARQLVRLWALVQKGKQLLDEKLEGTVEDDEALEELLGRVWLLTELRERGHVKADLDLVELAFERFDDPAREERIEQSWLVDLGDGSVHVERWFRPFVALAHTPQKEAHEGLLRIREAALYPGLGNRRVRWEAGALGAREVAAADLARLHGVASSVEQAFARFKDQLRNPLAPDDLVVLVAARELGHAGGVSVLVGPEGARLALGDVPLAPHPSTANLALAAGALHAAKEPLAVLIRLWRGLDDNAVRGQPLALVAGERRIRLGM